MYDASFIPGRRHDVAAIRPTRTMRIARHIAIHATLLSLLPGCARFEARPLSAQRMAEQFDARTLDDPALKQFLEQNLNRKLSGWPLREWDGDVLTLVALYYHPSLTVARAQWAVAQAGIRTAGERPNFAAEIGPQYTSNPDSGVSPWVATFTFTGTVETAGKRGYRIAKATHESDAARFNLAEQAWQVRSRLRSSLLDYAAAQRRVALQKQALPAQQRVLKLLEGRLSVGAIAAPELTLQRVALIKAQADMAEAQRQAIESRAAVAEALGLPLRALEGHELSFDLSAMPEAGWDLESTEARSRALHSRPDILAALAEYEASQSSLQLEIARQYPDIQLGPGYEFDQGEHRWGLAAGADLAVFNRNKGSIGEAQAKRTEAAARLLALQAQVVAQIDRALAALTASREQLRQIETLLETQRRHVQAVAERVNVGAADQLDLSSSQLEASSTELAHLDALVKAQEAIGDLEDAVQIPLEVLASVEQDPHNPPVKKESRP